MRRNNFVDLPNVRYKRSLFDMSHGTKTSFNMGELVPISWQEVLPGDSWNSSMSAVLRVPSTFVKPLMDNLWCDVYHFFVPARLVYDDFEKVFGNPNPSQYSENGLAEIPFFSDKPDGDPSIMTVYENTVGDYLGLPPNVDVSTDVSVLPFRAFALIYDTWFRNQNTVDEMYIQRGGTASSEFPNNNDWSPNNYCGKLPKVMKRKDYFTTALLQPQKGQASGIPIALGMLPVRTSTDNVTYTDPPQAMKIAGDYSNIQDGMYNILGVTNSGQVFTSEDMGSGTYEQAFAPINLWADGTDTTTSMTINDLRLAMAQQRVLERDAQYGSRYNEYLLGAFGVSSPDMRLQLPEFLGGQKFPISIQTIVQSSSTINADDISSPLGNVAGLSLTNGQSRFVKGFTEHGFIFTLACVRQMHTYSQGIHKKWFRRKREDMFDTLYAHIGEQPVYTAEIFSDGSSPKSNVFGYQEAWADYRQIPNSVTAGMRPQSTAQLGLWTLADNYANAPVISEEFTNETATYLDRTLSVPSTSLPQFIGDFYFSNRVIRVMPTYSVPSTLR